MKTSTKGSVLPKGRDVAPDNKPDRMTYTVEEAAQLLSVSRSFAYDLAASERLPGCRKLGHRYLVLRSVLDDWLSGGEAA